MSNGNGNGSQAAIWAAVLVVVLGAAGFLLFATGSDEEVGKGTTTVLDREPGTPPGPGAPDIPTLVVPIEPEVPPAAVTTADAPIMDQWSALYLGGAKSGHGHRVVWREDRDGKEVWVSTDDGVFEMDRGGSLLRIAMTVRIVEDADGQVIEFENKTDMGTQVQVVSGRLVDGKFEMEQMGRAMSVPYPEGALGPVAVQRMLVTKLAAKEKSFVIPSFSGDAPDKVDTAAYTLGGMEKVDIFGHELMAQRIDVQSSLMPIKARRWVSADGNPVQDQVDLPFGTMTIKPCAEAFAKTKNDPAEVFLSSFVKPQRAIPKPRKLPRAVYKLGSKTGALESIYEGEGQRITGRADGKLTVEISWPVSPKGGTTPFTLPAKIEGMDSYLLPSSFIDSDDPLVQKLAAEAVGDEKNAIEVAKRIETYVREKITEKNMNVGFATAAEVAETLEGDCSEHGVLCAALARAVGLPARVVIGLAYLPPMKGVAALEGTGGFGFHMWAEVYVGDDYWYPIDAAIGMYDATHIVTGKSDMSGASPGYDMMMGTMTVMGDLTIEVVEP